MKQILIGAGLMLSGYALHSQNVGKPTVTVAAKPIHHAAKKLHHHTKKHLTYKAKVLKHNDKPDIEEIEARLTTVEERLNRYGIS